MNKISNNTKQKGNKPKSIPFSVEVKFIEPETIQTLIFSQTTIIALYVGLTSLAKRGKIYL